MLKIKRIILIGMFGLLGISTVAKADNIMNLEQFLTLYFYTITSNISIDNSYQKINIKYPNIKKSDRLYSLMQKAIANNIFPNDSNYLPLNDKITQYDAYMIIKIGFENINLKYSKTKFVDAKWINNTIAKIKSNIINREDTIDININNSGYVDEKLIDDISKKLESNSFLGTKEELYNSIQDSVKSSKDEYTMFFSPTEAKYFNEGLQGEFEGIGAYVDMPKLGIVLITDTIVNSPAAKAGFKAGDQIIKVGENNVTENTDITTVISWIKGPADTKINITVSRDTKIISYDVYRKKIFIRDITSKILKDDICYMDINIFGFDVFNQFEEDFKKVFDNGKKCKKYIRDVRNNPGGSLDGVSKILDYFVPNNKSSVLVVSKSGEEKILAKDLGIKLTNKKINVLINGYSASAAEVFAGGIKDYVIRSKIIGEQSFGKGSVQELVEYSDGSMLKYTIAKRYTGKSKTSIDKVGITPDEEVLDDKKTLLDEQLEYAIKN